MLYQLTIHFKKPDWELYAGDVCYAILGAVLNLFHNNEAIYRAIAKLSFSIGEEAFSVMMTIQWETMYNQIVQHLLSNPQQSISVNGIRLSFQELRLDFRVFDLDLIEFKPFSKFQLKFYSPTFIRQGNILYALPQPETFLFSVREKLQNYYPQLQNSLSDPKSFKKRLKRAIYIWEFKLKTHLITIKKNKKSWVLGYGQYYLNPEYLTSDDPENGENIQRLYLILQAIRFLWIGSWVKLGCGNVGCFIG